MFHNNPFLGAAEQFADAAILYFAASDVCLAQQTDGRNLVTVTLVPSEPPSPYGTLSVEFNYDAGDASRLRTARELEEGVADVEEEAVLIINRTYTVAASGDDDAVDVAERLWEYANRLPLTGDDSGVVVARCNRLAGAAEEPMRSAELAVTLCESYNVVQIHGRNWAHYAQECATLVADLAEIAVGARPPAEHNPLTGE